MADDLGTAGLPAMLIEAAHQAAQADGVLVAHQQQQQQHHQQNGAAVLQQQQARNAMAIAAAANARQQQQQQQQAKSSPKKKGPPLRRGKWTPEEEAYAARLIQEFKAGLLPLTDGTTLRTFLSKLLNCDPMRISKKFVGSNCIGKQVFRRRTADLNRLTPDQIQQSRAELSELERRFLDRVAQTNRVKNTGCAAAVAVHPGPTHAAAALQQQQSVMANNNTTAAAAAANASAQQQQQQQQQKNDLLQSLGLSGSLNTNNNNNGLQNNNNSFPFSNFNSNNQGNTNNNNPMDAPNPPWLQPPLGYKHGTGQAFAASHLSTANARAAAAGRALLGFSNSASNFASNNAIGSISNNAVQQLAAAAQQQHGSSAGLLAMAELQRRVSQHSPLQSALQHQQQQNYNSSSATNLLAAAAAARSGSNSALHQFAAQSAAASAHLSDSASMNSLLLKTGLSRDQLSQLARDRVLPSSGSIGNLMNRQNSFDALMSIDFQSLQSIDNLANLIQTGGGVSSNNNMPASGMKNADFGAMLAAMNSRSELNNNNNANTSDADLASVARHLANAASNSRMDALLNNLSSNNNNNGLGGLGGREGDSSSSATISNLLQSIQGNMNPFGAASSNPSAASLLNNYNASNLSSGNGNVNQSAVNFANFMHPDSSTGLSALRMQDGINQRHSTSVDDFLSLVAAGDIPHQDPNLLNVPLLQQQDAAAKLLAQQQLLQGNAALAQQQLLQGNAALANALAGRSFGNFAAASGSSNTNGSSNGLFADLNLSNSTSAAALAMAARNGVAVKREADSISGEKDSQGDLKR